MKTLILILTLFSFSFKLFAQTPLEWQKISLEEKLTVKVKNSLTKVLEENQYVVETQVSIMDPGLPNFDDMTKVGLKVSDIPFDNSKGDYIAFSKIGLEVPVIEKYMNDNQQKLKELHRFNESYNIFKNIEKIEMKVWLSDQLSPELATKAENIVRSLKFSVGEVQPQITFEKIAIEEVKVDEPIKKDDGLSLKEILDFISDFGNAIGLITATLLFGFIAYKLLKLWEEIMQRLNPHEEVQNEDVPEEDEASAEDASNSMVDEMENIEEFLNSPDFERFRLFFEKNQTGAVQLLRKWIREQSTESKLALKAVAQQLTDDELVKVFENLDMEMRSSWKYTLDHFLTNEELKEANLFISEEVVRTIIEPSQIKDSELIDMILSLTSDMAKQFILKEKVQGKVLMNLLTPQFSSKILDSLDDEKATSLIQESLSFDFSQVKDSFLGFKASLQEFIGQNKRKPFGDKILQMLPDFNPLKEKMLYEFLAKNKMKAEIYKMACEYFPSELIAKLSSTAMKRVLQAYDKVDRAVLLLSLEGEIKDHMINSFAEEGSALREMLEFDFEEVQNNQVLMSRVENKADEIWTQFVVFTRSELKRHKEYNSEVEALVESWTDELIGDFQTSSSLKAA